MARNYLVLVTALAAVPGCSAGAAGSAEQQRAASALFGEYESVFYVTGKLIVDGGHHARLPKQNADALRAPFAHLIGGLRAISEGAPSALFGNADAVFVGAKDFRPPSGRSGLGDVQSRFCYVIVLGGRSSIKWNEIVSTWNPHASQGSVWEWLVPPTEGQPKRYSFYSSQVGRSFVLVSNSRDDLRAVSEKLSAIENHPNFEGVHDWREFSRHEVWGYRAYRRTGDGFKGSGGASAVVPGAQALEFFVDLKRKAGVLRLYGSTVDVAKGLDNFRVVPPLKGTGRSGVWETLVQFSGDSASIEETLGVMGLLGFGVYV